MVKSPLLAKAAFLLCCSAGISFGFFSSALGWGSRQDFVSCNRFETDAIKPDRKSFFWVVAEGGKTNPFKGFPASTMALFAACSLLRFNPKYSISMLTAHASPDFQRIAKSMGVKLYDFSWFNPKEYYRLETGPGIQQRKDGANTYFKFLLFNQTQHSQIMYLDADVLILKSIDHLFENVSYSTFTAAHPEVKGRTYEGMNTHLMMIRPSDSTFKSLLKRAKSGNYRPFTNTEQDVIESEFATTATFFDPYPPVRHYISWRKDYAEYGRSFMDLAPPVCQKLWIREIFKEKDTEVL